MVVSEMDSEFRTLFWSIVFIRSSLSYGGSCFRQRQRSLIDLNLLTKYSTVYLPTPGIHFNINPRTQFTGTLDLEFLELNLPSVETVTTSSEESMDVWMYLCIQHRYRKVWLISVVRWTLKLDLNWMLLKALERAASDRGELWDGLPQQMYMTLEIEHLLSLNRCYLQRPSMMDEARSEDIFLSMMQSNTNSPKCSDSITQRKSPREIFWYLISIWQVSINFWLKNSLNSVCRTQRLSTIRTNLNLPRSDFFNTVRSLFWGTNTSRQRLSSILRMLWQARVLGSSNLFSYIKA